MKDSLHEELQKLEAAIRKQRELIAQSQIRIEQLEAHVAALRKGLNSSKGPDGARKDESRS